MAKMSIAEMTNNKLDYEIKCLSKQQLAAIADGDGLGSICYKTHPNTANCLFGKGIIIGGNHFSEYGLAIRRRLIETTINIRDMNSITKAEAMASFGKMCWRDVAERFNVDKEVKDLSMHKEVVKTFIEQQGK